MRSLPTLRPCSREHARTARGRCGSLLLQRSGLAPPTPCRPPGALTVIPVFEKHLTAAGLTFFPKSGHVLNLEEPALFNEMVERFIALVEAGGWGVRDPRSILAGVRLSFQTMQGPSCKG